MIAHSKTTRYAALTYAPSGRDAAVAAELLREVGVESAAQPDLISFQSALGDDICLCVLTEESLRSADLRAIAAWINNQPAWSDLPFVILTRRGGGPERNPGAARLSEILGNVTFLERPFHPTTFVSIVRTALRGRQRQYDARARIEELNESEERLRTALLAGRLGSWELDLDTEALLCSSTCKALFGRAPSESFSYSDLLSSTHPDDQWRMQNAVKESIETGKDYLIEYRTVWPDGTVHWAEIRARRVYDRRANKGRLVGVSSDITERKAAEDNLRQLNESLEQRVMERTAELERAHHAVLAEVAQREQAEEQLRHAQKMETIGQLTGGVAHDFNNLLMVVLGNLELLQKRTGDDARMKRLIDGAMQGAQRGAALTQRLLAFARRQDLNVEPKSITDLIRGMTDLLQRSIGPRIALEIDVPDKLPLALVDANQVELALLNLAVNARDAMPNGGVITIEADQKRAPKDSELAAGAYVRLTVSDNGCGMDSVTLSKATEPFFSTKEVGKGTGLGLSMIHGLAVQLNGSLRLSSEVGKGTRAELWLPATTSVTEDKRTALHESIDDAAVHRATILVVDDDALIAMSTVDMLEDLGHEVIETNSGTGALEILRNGRLIDLMITDYSMPQMTGIQLATAAREIRPELPILLATGYAELPPGIDLDLPRLAKPYQQGQLASEIAKILMPSS